MHFETAQCTLRPTPSSFNALQLDVADCNEHLSLLLLSFEPRLMPKDKT